MPTKKENHKKKKEDEVGLDFGGGNISFGGLFQGIGNLIDLVAKMEEEGQEGGTREKEFISPSGKVKAVYGLSVKTGLGGRPTVEAFGNLRKTAKGPVVEEEREPLVDIFDEQDSLLIIAELPGVDKGHITTKVDGDILTISAAEGDRKYHKEVILPDSVDSSTLSSTYKNGVLEIKFSKKL